MPRHPLITISTTEQFKQMLSKHKAFSVYIHALKGAPEHATLQDITGHPELSIKPAQFPSVPISSANPTHSNTTISSRESASQASHWDNLCCEYSDFFEAPGFLIEH